MRHIKIFLSSSFGHSEARQKIKKYFENNDEAASGVKFSVYLHEENATLNIPYVEAQTQIDASSDEHQVFMLYAGDRVGEMTKREFHHAAEAKDWNVKHICIIHCDEDKLKIPADSKLKYDDWQDFYVREVQPFGFYEDKITPAELENKIATIKHNLATLSMVPLSPGEINYRRVAQQEEYRRFTEYIEREDDVDIQLSELLSFPDGKAPAPLTIVHGMSLAGKTRSVTHAIANLDPAKIKIHFLRGVSSATDNAFPLINAKKQFFEGCHHILFIDEFSRLLFNSTSERFSNESGAAFNTGVKSKFFELMDFASDNPGRLTIIGTTADDFNDVMDIISKSCNSEKWLDDIRSVEVKPMSVQYMYTLYRQLKVQNKISPDVASKIKEGMPIGALFIELTNLKKKYGEVTDQKRKTNVSVAAMRYRYLFHAVKSLQVWKYHSAHDSELLEKYLKWRFGKTFEAFDSEKLYNTLCSIPSFFSVKLSDDLCGFDYFIEPVISDEVLRFLDDDAAGALCKLVDFIIDQFPASKYEELSKFITRIPMHGLDAYKNSVVSYAVERLGLDAVLEANEETPTFDDASFDWADLFSSKVLEVQINTQGFEAAVDIYKKRPTHNMLAVLLDKAEDKSKLDELLYKNADRSSGLLPEIAGTTSRTLMLELLENMSFDDACEIFSTLDIDKLTAQTEPQHTLKNEISGRIRKQARKIVEKIMSKVERLLDFLKILAELKSKNERRVDAGKTSWFSNDTDLYFNFLSRYSWQLLSENITSADLWKLFNKVYGIEAGENERMNKAHILNCLSKPMNYLDTAKAWKSMGALRDSYTLTNMISKLDDYSSARMYLEEFQREELGKKVVIDIKIVNRLLKTARVKGDIIDCISLYQERGKLPAKPRYEIGIEDYFTIDDKYTPGIILDKDIDKRKGKDNAFKREFLKQQKKEGIVRSEKMFISYLESLGSYHDIEQTIYGPVPDIMTAEEQENLKHHHIGIGHLLPSAHTPEEIESAKKHLNDAISNARENGSLRLLFDPEHAAIVNEYIQNTDICPDVHKLEEEIRSLKEIAGFEIVNDKTKSVLMSRMVCSDCDSATKADYCNRMILANTKISRESLKQLVYWRMSLSTDNFTLFADELQEYPMVVSKGEWKLVRITLFAWVRNMLINRFMNKYMLCDCLKYMAERIVSCEKNSAERARWLKKYNEMANDAKKYGIYLDHRKMMKLNTILRDVEGARNLKDITLNYSFVRELCYKIENKHYQSAEEIFAQIREYEDKNGKIYRTPGLYEQILNMFEQGDDENTIRRILPLMQSEGFDNKLIINPVLYTLCHYIYTVEDLNMLIDAVGDFRMNKEYLPAIFTAVNKNCKNKGHDDDGSQIIRRMLFDESGRFCVPYKGRSTIDARVLASRLFMRLTDIPLDQLVAEADSYGFTLYAKDAKDTNDMANMWKQLWQREHGEAATEWFMQQPGVAANLDKLLESSLRAMTTGKELEQMLAEYRGKLTARHGEILLYRINEINKDCTDFKKRFIFRTDILDSAEKLGLAERLSPLVAPGNYFKTLLINNVDKNMNSKDADRRRFAAFCERVLS